MQASRRLPRILAVSAPLAVLGLAALLAPSRPARGDEPAAENALYEAAIALPKMTPDDKEAVEKALADPAISKVDVRPETHEALLSYPTTTDSVDELAIKACDRVRKLGGRLSYVNLVGVIAAFAADWGELKGFVIYDRDRKPEDGPKWQLHVLLKPAKDVAFNGAGQPDLKVTVEPPEGVTLAKLALNTDPWTLEKNVVTDKSGVTSKARDYSLGMTLPPHLDEKRLLIRATVELVVVPPGKAHVLKVVVPLDKKWYRK